MNALPLLAFGFLHPAMLGWLAAAVVPIVIHLLSRRRYRNEPWAAMRYLQAAIERHHRRLLLRQWLLLALRAAVIVLVALAVAQPFLDQPVASGAARERTHHVLVIDGSFSMAYREDGETLFERAKQAAATIISEAPTGDGFSVIVMADPPQPIVARPAFARDRVAGVVGELEPTHTPADLSGTLAMIRRLMSDSQEHAPDLRRTAVTFLTDLQSVTWGTPIDAVGADRAATGDGSLPLRSLGSRATIRLIDFGRPERGNTAVVALAATGALPTVGRTVTLLATLRHFGPRSPESRELEWLVDGRTIGESRVKLDTDGTATAALDYRALRAGDRAVEVRATDDALPIDDRRYLALHVRDEIRVLCIDGRPSPSTMDSAAEFVFTALAPIDSQTASRRNTEPDGPLPVVADLAGERALLERDLSGYDALILCNVARWTDGEAAALRRFVGAGGVLVVFLGEQIDVPNYNQQLARGDGQGAEGQGAILPGRIDELIVADRATIDPQGHEHPALDVFRDTPGTGLNGVPVTRYFRLLPEAGEAPAADQGATVLLRVGERGHPLLLEQPVGQGRVLLFATAAHPDWTAMPLLPSFVPLMQEMLAWSLTESAQGHNVIVGRDPIPGRPISDFTDPTPGAEPLQLTSGFFTLPTRSTRADTVDDGETTRTLYAANVHTSESDLRVVLPAYLRDVLGDRVELVVPEGELVEANATNPDPLEPPALADPSESSVSPEATGGVETAQSSELQSSELQSSEFLPVVLLGAALLLALVDTLWSWRLSRSDRVSSDTTTPRRRLST